MMRNYLIFLTVVFLTFVTTACKKNNQALVETKTSADSAAELLEFEPEEAVLDSTGYSSLTHPLSFSIEKRSVYENHEKTNHMLIAGHYSYVHMSKEDAEKFPELENTLESYNNEIKVKQDGFLRFKKKDACQVYDVNGEDFNHYEIIESAFIKRADYSVTSILYYSYSYLGAIHGMYEYYGKNYDSATGKELSISDVVNDQSQLYSLISQQLDRFYPHLHTRDANSIEELMKEGENFSWTLDYNGITFYFPPYLLGSFAAGAPTVTLSNTEFPDLVKEVYKTIPEAFIIPIAYSVPVYYDLTGDGKVDEIMFEMTLANEVMKNGIIIRVNGNEYTEKFYGYDGEAYIVHTKSGNNYLLTVLSNEIAHPEIYCYDISGDINKIDNIPFGPVVTFDSGVSVFEMMYDPYNMILEQTTHAFSSVKGSKKFRLTEDGKFVTDDTLLKFKQEDMITFTVKKEIEADVCDINTNEISGKRMLKSGEKVLYYSTDAEKYGYLKCEDGTICRMEYGFDEKLFDYTVNGYAINSIFEGVIYRD